MEAARNAIGRCTSRNGPTPTNHITMATRAAIAAFVAMVLSQSWQPAHHADRQPVPKNEQISGTKAEHDNGVPIQVISKPTPARERQILLHGQRADVTDPASVEIARTRVVDGV